MPQPACVVLVPSGRVCDPAAERSLAELSRRGHPVWRVRQPDPPPDARDRMVRDALAAGLDELFLVEPDVVFDPDDVGRLRGHGLPLVCGVYPLVAATAFACEFLPGTAELTFGFGGGPIPVATCGQGFSLLRGSLLETLA